MKLLILALALVIASPVFANSVTPSHDNTVVTKKKKKKKKHHAAALEVSRATVV